MEQIKSWRVFLATALLLCCLLSPVYAADPDVREVSWGMHPDEVIAREGEPEEESLFYATTYQEIPVVLEYFFVEGKLTGASFVTLADKSADEHYADFLGIAGQLTREYGKPQRKQQEKRELMLWGTKRTVITLSYDGTWVLTLEAREEALEEGKK